jgi:hypothetical protein
MPLESASSAEALPAAGLNNTCPAGDGIVSALYGTGPSLRHLGLTVLPGPRDSSESVLLDTCGGPEVPPDGEVAYRDRRLQADERKLAPSDARARGRHPLPAP